MSMPLLTLRLIPLLFLFRVRGQSIVTSFCGGGAATSSGTTNGAGTVALFNTPAGLSIDGSGNLYVAEATNARVRMITPAGVASTLAGGGAGGTTSGSIDGTGTVALFKFPYGTAVDAVGSTVYIADSSNNKVRQLVVATGAVTTLAGGGTVAAGGSAQGFLDGTGTAAGFHGVSWLTTDATGSVVYAADNGNVKVRKIIKSSQLVTTLAGGGAAGTGVPGANDGVGTAALFAGVAGMVLGASGSSLYVLDSNNHRLRAVSISTTEVTTIAGGGGASGTNSGFLDGAGTNALFSTPLGLTVDGNNNLYVADMGNNRIRLVTPGGAVTTLAGGSTFGFTDGVGTNALLRAPLGIALDSSMNLFIADSSNQKIRRACLANASYCCPPAFACSSNLTSMALCPLGAACPAGTAIPCAPGSYSASLGATTCTPCSGGTYGSTSGLSTAACSGSCPAGHFCPQGSAHWNTNNCGKGNYCPWGSAAPFACPAWGSVDLSAGKANGPAFATDVAACRNHCFYGGIGQLSTC